MEMRIVVPDSASATMLAERLAVAFGSHRSYTLARRALAETWH